MRLHRLLAVAAASLACAATSSPASAATTASHGSSTVTSYGFVCSNTYHWLRENWPNISVSGSAMQQVYVRTFLYRWTGSAWNHAATSPWYVGVSNNTGRKPLGTVAGAPYYFVTLSGGLTGMQGHVFNNLSAGYYATIEQYYTAGTYWWANTALAGTSQAWCAA